MRTIHWIHRLKTSLGRHALGACAFTLAGITPIHAEDVTENLIFLDQGWDVATRDTYNYTPQGTRLIPIAWYLALEQPNSTALFNESGHIEALRFLPPTVDSTGTNPHGLPVGFALDRPVDPVVGQQWMGYTCAACHSNDITYKGTRMRIDGAPAMGDFGRMLERLALAVDQTINSEEKFQRFAQRLLGDVPPDDPGYEQLKLGLATYNTWLASQAALRHPPYPAGPARVDAFGQILNQLLAIFPYQPINHRSPAAPVSYPFLWLTTDMEYVQWNALASSPIGRNGGEVMGVFSRVNLRAPDEPKYDSSILYRDLDRLEDMLRSLTPPKWPTRILGGTDAQQVAHGRHLFEEYCASCHNTKYQERHYVLTNPATNLFGRWFIKVDVTHYKEVGTDPYYITDTVNRLTVAPQDGSLDPEYSNLPIAPAALVFTNMVFNIVTTGLVNEGLTQEEIIDFNDYRFRPPSTPGGQPEVYAPLDPTLQSFKSGPLNGIWATAPFLHNGSVPTLYDLLSHEDERPSLFYVGSREMDPDKVGFISQPEGDTVDPDWFLFDTRIRGNGNQGHIYPKDGLTEDEKMALIEFMKTL